MVIDFLKILRENGVSNLTIYNLTDIKLEAQT